MRFEGAHSSGEILSVEASGRQVRDFAAGHPLRVGLHYFPAAWRSAAQALSLIAPKSDGFLRDAT
jgi:hypothetical protein